MEEEKLTSDGNKVSCNDMLDNFKENLNEDFKGQFADDAKIYVEDLVGMLKTLEEKAISATSNISSLLPEYQNYASTAEDEHNAHESFILHTPGEAVHIKAEENAVNSANSYFQKILLECDELTKNLPEPYDFVQPSDSGNEIEMASGDISAVFNTFGENFNAKHDEINSMIYETYTTLCSAANKKYNVCKSLDDASSLGNYYWDKALNFSVRLYNLKMYFNSFKEGPLNEIILYLVSTETEDVLENIYTNFTNQGINENNLNDALSKLLNLGWSQSQIVTFLSGLYSGECVGIIDNNMIVLNCEWGSSKDNNMIVLNCLLNNGFNKSEAATMLSECLYNYSNVNNNFSQADVIDVFLSSIHDCKDKKGNLVYAFRNDDGVLEYEKFVVRISDLSVSSKFGYGYIDPGEYPNNNNKLYIHNISGEIIYEIEDSDIKNYNIFPYNVVSNSSEYAIENEYDPNFFYPAQYTNYGENYTQKIIISSENNEITRLSFTLDGKEPSIVEDQMIEYFAKEDGEANVISSFLSDYNAGGSASNSYNSVTGIATTPTPEEVKITTTINGILDSDLSEDFREWAQTKYLTQKTPEEVSEGLLSIGQIPTAYCDYSENGNSDVVSLDNMGRFTENDKSMAFHMVDLVEAKKAITSEPTNTAINGKATEQPIIATATPTPTPTIDDFWSPTKVVTQSATPTPTNTAINGTATEQPIIATATPTLVVKETNTATATATEQPIIATATPVVINTETVGDDPVEEGTEVPGETTGETQTLTGEETQDFSWQTTTAHPDGSETNIYN